ncbi:hypothetical protein FJZ31_42575 [Candidatus Poribacteria bacterium]|nr:hypothetical protein [Candidatus Poribacteria bacterium]
MGKHQDGIKQTVQKFGYITRLFDPQKRTWNNIVVLSEQAWKAINGSTTPATLEQVTSLLGERTL